MDLATLLANIERRLSGVERSRQMGSSSIETAEGDDVDVSAALVSGVTAEAAVAEVVETVSDVQESIIDVGNLADEAVETANVAMESANGKNSVTHSLNAPAGEPNIEGDTWFQRDEAGHIVAQYRGLGDGGWAPVTLSHEVIASLDLGKATVGFLQGDRIAANALDGKVITGPLIRTKPSGTRWQLGTDASGNYIFGYAASSVRPAALLIDDGTGALILQSPDRAGNGRFAQLSLFGDDGLDGAGADLSAAAVSLGGTKRVALYSGSRRLEVNSTGTAVTGPFEAYNGITAVSMRAAEYLYTDNSVGSTTAVAGAPAGDRGGAGTFVAPPSGVVRIDYGGQTRAIGAGYAGIGIEVRRTSATGAIFKGYDINDAVLNYTTTWSFGMTLTVLRGLTPGATYYVRSMVSSSEGSAQFVRGRFVVTPSV